MLTKLELEDGIADNLVAAGFGRKVNAAIDAVNAMTTGGIDHILKMTQADYDALETPDASTLYVIVG